MKKHSTNELIALYCLVKDSFNRKKSDNLAKKGLYQSALNVMEQCSRDELRLFYKWYLKKDPLAQLKLLVRFPDKIDLPESRRYEWLIYKAISQLRSGRTYLGINRQKRLGKLFMELHAQAADAVVLQNYLKSFHICSTALSAIRLLSVKEVELTNVLKQLYGDYLETLFKLYNAGLPPDLLELFTDSIDKEVRSGIDLSTHKYYRLSRLYLRVRSSIEGSATLDYPSETVFLRQFRSLEQAQDYVYAILSEPWSTEVWTHLSKQKIPKDLLRYAILDLLRDEEIQVIKTVSRHFSFREIFMDAKHRSILTRLTKLEDI